MKKLAHFSLTAVALISASVFADSVKPSKMTCEEFVGLDEAVRPQVVYFIQGATKNGRKEDMEISVDKASKPVAWVLDECSKTPKATVWQKVENYVHKMAKKL